MVRKIFGLKKMSSLEKKIESKIILGPKRVWVRKNIGSKKILVQKDFGSEKIVVPKILVRKDFRAKKLGQRQSQTQFSSAFWFVD